MKSGVSSFASHVSGVIAKEFVARIKIMKIDT